MTIKEELLEQAREFLESVSVRSRKQVAQDLFHAVVKKWPDEGFTALDKKYPGAVKNVKKSVKDSMLTRVQRRHARRHPK